MKETCQEKYNCDYAIQSKEVRNQSIETSKKLYGVKYPMQSKDIQDKAKATCRERYGVDYPGQSKEVKDKIKQTCKERYGVEYTFQSKEIKDKIKQTCNEKYGCDYASQSEEIKNKMKETCKQRYGVDCASKSSEIKNKMKETNNKKYGGNAPACSEEVQRKMQQTMLKKYGVEHALQNRELLNKALDSFQFNGTGPCSRAQRYINYILNGNLNKHMCGSLVDIYIEKENIAIEYDGSGHFLGDIINGNKIPSKEALLKEKEREDKIINNGCKIIRFIATKDRIPSDEVILNLVNEFKNSDFKVVRIDFEKGTIEKDYKEKSHHNFGELRKITQKDLEKFEKQEKNISEN